MGDNVMYVDEGALAGGADFARPAWTYLNEPPDRLSANVAFAIDRCTGMVEFVALRPIFKDDEMTLWYGNGSCVDHDSDSSRGGGRGWVGIRGS